MVLFTAYFRSLTEICLGFREHYSGVAAPLLLRLRVTHCSKVDWSKRSKMHVVFWIVLRVVVTHAVVA